MRQINTVTGRVVRATCLGCELADGSLVTYEGTIYRGAHFHAHQDLELALPGLVILSTIRHVSSLASFTAAEESDFARLLVALRRALAKCGYVDVYLFQNEDSPDHFHVWLFPVYEWMASYGSGPALLHRAWSDLRRGMHRSETQELLSVVRALRLNLEVAS